jgi:phosphatidylglycerol:prolipoprotein diacylglycerol transferase
VIDSVIFRIGFLEIRWYSVAYIIGIIGSWYVTKYFNRKEKLFDEKTFEDDYYLYLILGIIIGGRLGYVLFYNLPYYLSNFLEIFKVWKGGMSFHGGLIGVLVSFYLLTKKQKISFWGLLDIVSISVPIGLFFGRIANFINQELYGRVTDSKIGMVFANSDGMPRHPSQLYEAFFEGIVLFLIMFFSAKKNLKHNGRMSGIFLIGYGIMRFFIEFFREPDEQIGYILAYFTMGQILCLFMVVVGILFFKQKSKF